MMEILYKKDFKRTNKINCKTTSFFKRIQGLDLVHLKTLHQSFNKTFKIVIVIIHKLIQMSINLKFKIIKKDKTIISIDK